MQFHDYIGSKGIERLSAVRSGDGLIFDELYGPRAHDWKPFRVRRVRPSLREGLRPSDSPYHGTGALIFRRSAVDALRDMLDAHGELLPLEDEEGIELYAYNPWTLDALDQDRSDLETRMELLSLPISTCSFPQSSKESTYSAKRACEK